MSRHFPNWLKAYIDYTRDSESPTSFHFWTGVSTIAGALRRRVWIPMRKFTWTPNFYTILVGPPGIAAKSTSISIGMRLLSKVPGVQFGPESMTWQALADSLASATEYVKYVSPDGKDYTLAQSALTVSVGELGTFLTTQDDKLLSFLIRMWEGQEDQFLHKTRTQPLIEVKNPWLNVIGATTPAWLRTNFPEHLIGGGLTSRIIFVYGDKKRQLIPYPDEVIHASDYDKLEKELIDDLKDIALASGPFILSSDARAWGHQWYSSLYNGARPLHMASDRYSGYIARKQTHVHKLAIVLTAARNNSKIIERDALIEADQLIEGIESDMIKVFESIGVVDEARHIAEIVALVRAHTILTADELWGLCVNMMQMRDFESSLKAAVRGGLLRMGSKGGRQAVEVVVKGGQVH